mmetsp:Transcript_26985/g.88247  ORF Transcript_26985/g.88247 Transcript_26985/m.88247 type:complete len:438 (-) Transcript_26985:96-1409(-)
MAISDSQLRKIYMRIPRKSDAIKSVVSIDDAIQTLRELSRVYKEARNRLKEDKDKEDSPKASKNDLKAWIAEQKSLQRQGGKDEAAKALSWETKFERGQTEDRSVPHRSEGLFEDDASPEQRQPQAVRFKLDDDERKLDLETSIGVEKSIDDLRACDSTIEGYSYVKGDADDIRDVQAAVTPSTASSPPRSTPATASGPSASPMSEDVVPFEDLIPQSVPDALRKAAEFLEQNELDVAHEICCHVIRMNPRSAAAYYIRAESLRLQGSLAAAVDDAAFCLAIDANNWRAHRCRGLCLLELRMCGQALAHLNLALKLSGRTDSSSLIGLARCYQDLGKMEMALEHLDLAIRCRDEQEAKAFFHRGWCRMTLGDMVGASADFGKVAALDPQFHRRYLPFLERLCQTDPEEARELGRALLMMPLTNEQQQRILVLMGGIR